MEVHGRNRSPLGSPLQPQLFVSFRGEELRCGFVSHLVEALQRHGVNVFIDRLERRGEDLTNLFVRIEESTIALVIFSRKYTESIWCLDELVKIKERADQGLLKVIPIFFKVEPVTVKQLRGAFGDQFRDREWEYRCDKPRTKRWREALASVSSKIGMDIECENNVLRAQLVELSQKLHSLNSIIEMAEGVIGEVHTLPEFLINPWQMSYSSQTTLASADIFYL